MRAMTERVLGPLIGPRFDAFGCTKRGAHTDDTERERCVACAVESGRVDNPKDTIALVDDRGSVAHLEGGAETPWEHTRYFRPGVGLHRENGPAIDSAGLRAWFSRGVCTRADDPAIEWGDGHYAWFTAGRLHRIGGPAVSRERSTEYRVEGRLHRTDGPARSTLATWPPHGSAKPEVWHDFALDGALVSRELAWAAWVSNHTTIERSNWYALEFLNATINGSEPADAAFLPISASAATLALALHPSLEVGAEEAPPEVICPGPGTAAVDRVRFEPADEFTSRITPEQLLPSSSARRDLHYDADAFRRRIADAKRLGTLRSGSADVRATWRDPLAGRGPLRTGSYISADLEIDADLVAFGVDRMVLRRLFDEELIATYKEFGGALPPATLRYWLASAAHKYAEQLAVAYAAHGGFVEVSGRLAPLASIACDIERAFEFAAQNIADGVDHMVARSWATALVVASGYPKVPLRWGGNTPLDSAYTGTLPDPSLASNYYAKALDDLRERADARRFMDYVSRCYRWPSGAALTDW